MTVSQYGAAIAVKTALASGQEIVIRRPRKPAPREAKCHVGEQVGKQGNLTVFSVGFQKPVLGFWDIYFPSLPADREIAGRALLKCEVCATRKIVHLDPGELTDYTANRQLSLNCPQCRKSTIWRESEQETAKQPEQGPANPTRLAAPASSAGQNKRRHRRVSTEIAVCIRQAGWEDEVATTVDISRGGLSFTSSRQYPPGSYIQVAVPYTPTGVNVFVDARVAHSSKDPSQNLYRFGIMYIAENQPSS